MKNELPAGEYQIKLLRIRKYKDILHSHWIITKGKHKGQIIHMKEKR